MNAKYIPINPVEHENMIRTIIGAHQGSMDGNPTMWVVRAVDEAFQRGFGVGFNAGTMARVPKPPAPPAFRVQIPQGDIVDAEPGPTKALPFVDREPS